MLIQEGQDAKDSLKVYLTLNTQKDSLIAGLQREIVRKEGVIVRMIEQRNSCYNERKNLDEQTKALQFIADTQKQTIAKLAKPPKRFGLGAGVGYGYAFGAAKAGPVASVQVHYSLIRF